MVARRVSNLGVFLEIISDRFSHCILENKARNSAEIPATETEDYDVWKKRILEKAYAELKAKGVEI